MPSPTRRIRALTFPLVLLLALGVVTAPACKKPKGPRRCYTAADCGSNEVCTELASGAQTCLDRCDTVAAPTCTGGESCITLPGEDAQVDVCLPGGAVAEFDPCATSVECTKGAVCIQRSGMPNARCEKLCDVSAASTCMGSQACTAIDAAMSATRGTCIVP